MNFRQQLYEKSFLTDQGRVVRYDDVVFIVNAIKANTLRFGLELDYLKNPTERTAKAIDFLIDNIQTEFGLFDNPEQPANDQYDADEVVKSERIITRRPTEIKPEPAAVEAVTKKREPDFSNFVPAKKVISQEQANGRRLTPVNAERSILMSEKKERNVGGWKTTVDFLRGLEIGKTYKTKDIYNGVSHAMKNTTSVSAYKSMLTAQGYLQTVGVGYFKVIKEIPADVQATAKI